MKKKDYKEVLKKCFGKGRDDRYHAIAMLAIYGIFILILILIIRLSGPYDRTEPTPTASPTPTFGTIPKEEEKDNAENIKGTEINYSYSYTITYDGVNEVFLGKKIDDKEKFTLIKDGKSTNYAIVDDNYLILENDKYHITSNPSEYFKYCDVSDIFTLVENEQFTKDKDNVIYSISNKKISSLYKTKFINDNEQSNTVTMYIQNNNLKTLDLVLGNYFSSLKGDKHTLTIHMEFVDIGTTENFEINL